jgi:hypothetical protein
MCDFEKGIHNAFCNVVENILLLPVLLLACCHMHYCSAIIKHVRSLGLTNDHSNDATGLQNLCGLLFALAFLPTQMIVPVYYFIKENVIAPAMLAHAPIKSLLEDYFETTWLACK